MESITGPISRTISTKGMLSVYNSFNEADKKIFEQVRLCTGVAVTKPGKRPDSR